MTNKQIILLKTDLPEPVEDSGINVAVTNENYNYTNHIPEVGWNRQSYIESQWKSRRPINYPYCFRKLSQAKSINCHLRTCPRHVKQLHKNNTNY